MTIPRIAACAIGAVLACQASGAFAFSAEAIAEAEKLLTSANERYRKGEVTATDVAQAEVYVLDMKLEAGTIVRADYCAAVLPHLQAVVFGITREASVGQRTTAEMITAHREMHRTKSRCSQK
jgi:hypothetical protein